MKYYITHIDGKIRSITSTSLNQEKLFKRKKNVWKNCKVLEITERDFNKIQLGFDVSIKDGNINLEKGKNFKKIQNEKNLKRKNKIFSKIQKAILQKMAYQEIGDKENVDILSSEINSLKESYHMKDEGLEGDSVS